MGIGMNVAVVNGASQVFKVRAGETVILYSCGPVDGHITARLVAVASVSDGIAWVDDKQFVLDTAEPWDTPKDRASHIRYVLKPDTLDNRRFYGLA
jgi:hypothetical protein